MSYIRVCWKENILSYNKMQCATANNVKMIKKKKRDVGPKKDI